MGYRRHRRAGPHRPFRGCGALRGAGTLQAHQAEERYDYRHRMGRDHPCIRVPPRTCGLRRGRHGALGPWPPGALPRLRGDPRRRVRDADPHPEGAHSQAREGGRPGHLDAGLPEGASVQGLLAHPEGPSSFREGVRIRPPTTARPCSGSWRRRIRRQPWSSAA